MIMYRKAKQKIYNLIRDDDINNIYGNIFDGVIITLIIINILSVIADTFPMPAWYTPVSRAVEIISVIIFTIEYLLRLFTADLKYPDNNIFLAGVRHIFSFMALIDLLAILPFYIPFLFPIDLRVLRALRIFRLFRLFKFVRYTAALRTIGTVFKNKRHQLVSSMIVILVLMVIASVLMYHVEHAAQPDVFENAFSGLWWAVATFTTVGYGDIFPITVMGKVLSATIALLGIGLVAVPTGIISAGFIEMTDQEETNQKKEQEEKDKVKYCPYCGHRYEK